MENAELEELLRELLSDSSAERVYIRIAKETRSPHELFASLGRGAIVVAEFAASENFLSFQSRQEHLERYSRRIRACALRLEIEQFPELEFPNQNPDPKRLIVARIQQFLVGLVDTSELYQMVLLRSGQLIASAHPVDDLDSERLDLLHRQLSAAAQQSAGSAHGELVQPRLYGLRFWHGASLLGFSRANYSLDFVRYRSKMVSRELAHLLSMLDNGPDSPGAIAPIP
ncbi:MAG: hypothetical protein JKY56_08990 [Kofleriaceae bacterium]|nr:hypothetical protein [Kofleriaceae bacterium]